VRRRRKSKTNPTEENGEENMNEKTDTVSAIDQAISRAKARKAAKSGEVEGEGKPAKAPKEPKAPAEPKRPRRTDEEKAAIIAQRDAERATRKADREAKRAAAKAAKASEAKTPHMSKVDKAASKLPALSASAQSTLNEITANFTAAEVSALAAHLSHFNRVKATERALGQTIKADDTVRIVGGDARFIGLVGTVAKAQRIRCYVTVEGLKKPVYLFTSEVELVETPAEGIIEEEAAVG
jgi:hypothetical protein